MKTLLFVMCSAALCTSISEAVTITPGQMLYSHRDSRLVKYDPASGWSSMDFGGLTPKNTLIFDNSVLGLEHNAQVQVELTMNVEFRASWREVTETTPLIGLPFEDFQNVASIASTAVRANTATGQLLNAVLVNPTLENGFFSFESDHTTINLPIYEASMIGQELFVNFYSTHPEFIPIEIDLVDPTKPAAFWAVAEVKFTVESGRVLVPDGGATASLLAIGILGMAAIRRTPKLFLNQLFL